MEFQEKKNDDKARNIDKTQIKFKIYLFASKFKFKSSNKIIPFLLKFRFKRRKIIKIVAIDEFVHEFHSFPNVIFFICHNCSSGQR